MCSYTFFILKTRDQEYYRSLANHGSLMAGLVNMNRTEYYELFITLKFYFIMNDNHEQNKFIF